MTLTIRSRTDCWVFFSSKTIWTKEKENIQLSSHYICSRGIFSFSRDGENVIATSALLYYSICWINLQVSPTRKPLSKNKRSPTSKHLNAQWKKKYYKETIKQHLLGGVIVVGRRDSVTISTSVNWHVKQTENFETEIMVLALAEPTPWNRRPDWQDGIC